MSAARIASPSAGARLVVEPEAARESDLDGPVAAPREPRRGVLERGGIRQPRRPHAHVAHAETLVRPTRFLPFRPWLKKPSRIDLLELDIDLRLADLWREAGEISEWNLDVVAAFMRAAYGKGYCDALTEDSPGSLCHDHGYRVPGRRAQPAEQQH